MENLGVLVETEEFGRRGGKESDRHGALGPILR